MDEKMIDQENTVIETVETVETVEEEGTGAKARRSRKSRLNKKHGVFFNVIATILWIWAASYVLLILWGLLISLRDPNEYSYDKLRLFEKSGKLFFSNYALAMKTLGEEMNASYGQLVWNSVWFSLGATFMKLWATTMLAYVVAQYNFFGKKALYAFLILQIMLPVYGQTTANFILLDGWGLTNSPLFLLALGAGHGMYFLIMHSYFSNLSPTYREAAELDGANDFTICFRIMLPLGMASMLAIGLMTFIGTWNDYATVVLYLPDYPTLSGALYKYQLDVLYSDNFAAPTFFAGVFMAALPTAVLFIIFNKTLMENITIGGIKG